VPAPTPITTEAEYRILRRLGQSRAAAAKAVGISYSTARRVDQREHPIAALLRPVKAPS
jgi:hypothetical protein